MQKFRLSSDSIPAHKAAKKPEKRLGGEKEVAKNPIIPPNIADKAPRYVPRSMPIIGAIIAAAVMVLPGNPIMGEIDKKPKTTYKAVKQTVKATSFASNFLLKGIFALLLRHLE